MAEKYKRCFNCGNYFLEESENSENVFCSNDCRTGYVRCIVCGEYYEIPDGEVDLENFTCSEDCNKKYKIEIKKDRYDLDFSKLK